MAGQTDTVEIPLILENVLRYSLNEARKRMEDGEPVEPFTALAVGETLFFEVQDGNTPDECFAKARATVRNAQGAKTYGFCYDGFVDLETGRADALIAQGGMPGEPYGYAIGLIYRTDSEGKLVFHKDPIFVGPCQNYMLSLTPFSDSEEEDADEGGEAGAASDSGDSEATE